MSSSALERGGRGRKTLIRGQTFDESHALKNRQRDTSTVYCTTGAVSKLNWLTKVFQDQKIVRNIAERQEMQGVSRIMLLPSLF